MILKVKKLAIFCYGAPKQCCVTLRPQQRWELTCSKGDTYDIYRKGVAMEIDKYEFDNYFEVLK